MNHSIETSSQNQSKWLIHKIDLYGSLKNMHFWSIPHTKLAYGFIRLEIQYTSHMDHFYQTLMVLFILFKA